MHCLQSKAGAKVVLSCFCSPDNPDRNYRSWFNVCVNVCVAAAFDLTDIMNVSCSITTTDLQSDALPGTQSTSVFKR